MSKDSPEALSTIIKFSEFPPAIDGDNLDAMSDSEIFRLYGLTKLTTELRTTIYHELVKRAEKAGILREKFFADHGFKHDTEYRFVKREKEAKLLEAEELAAALNPEPMSDLSLPAEAGDAESCEREEAEVDESDDEPTTTNQPETPKAEKKPCHMCGVRKTRIEKLEKEILDLKQEKKDLKVMNKNLQESIDSLLKERKGEKKAAVRKQDAEKVIPEYRKDKLATGEFAVMQRHRGGWQSIDINKNEAAIDARLAELIAKAATSGAIHRTEADGFVLKCAGGIDGLACH
jgi:hypothetical protein